MNTRKTTRYRTRKVYSLKRSQNTDTKHFNVSTLNVFTRNTEREETQTTTKQINSKEPEQTNESNEGEATTCKTDPEMLIVTSPLFCYLFCFGFFFYFAPVPVSPSAPPPPPPPPPIFWDLLHATMPQGVARW